MEDFESYYRQRNLFKIKSGHENFNQELVSKINELDLYTRSLIDYNKKIDNAFLELSSTLSGMNEYLVNYAAIVNDKVLQREISNAKEKLQVQYEQLKTNEIEFKNKLINKIINC